jgi:hypothetical protein
MVVTDRMRGRWVGAGVGAETGAGVLGVGAVVTTGGWLGGVVGWSGWLRPQPATARPAMRRAVAIELMGRIQVTIINQDREGGRRTMAAW